MDYYRSHWVSIEPERLARYDQLLQWMPRWRGSWKVSSCRRTAGNRLRLWPGLGGAGACAAGAGGGVGEGGVGEGRGRGAGARSKGPVAGGRAPRSRRGFAGGAWLRDRSFLRQDDGGRTVTPKSHRFWSDAGNLCPSHHRSAVPFRFLPAPPASINAFQQLLHMAARPRSQDSSALG